jgi:predicted nucleic acid-binding protein
MIHSVRFTALLDANVLFPLHCRDTLFWFAHFDLYTPKWSGMIFNEWKAVMERKRIPEDRIIKQLELANQAFPDALTQNYESLIPMLDLPDENDRHVLAAAIKCSADVIVTNNLVDFPMSILSNFEIKAISPYDFLTDTIDLSPNQAVEAFKAMVLHKRNPPLSEFEVLNILRNNGLVNAANYLHALL